MLTSQLGNPDRKPLTAAQMRDLAARVRASKTVCPEKTMDEKDLTALGYGKEMARRILSLLEDEAVLDDYLRRGRRRGCLPIIRTGKSYPLRVRKCLGTDSPGCLWAVGDPELLNTPCIALVGSRDLLDANRGFASAAGEQAARQGYTLVSGNARGADRTAQDACLAAGGSVICVVADRLDAHPGKDRVLYLSEEEFDSPFSSHRALRRNRVIHSLAPVTLIAQCTLGSGGTWSGAVHNLQKGWSDVWCFQDGSPATAELIQMGAQPMDIEQLSNLSLLKNEMNDLFDRV